jgi:hypothetical protein
MAVGGPYFVTSFRLNHLVLAALVALLHSLLPTHDLEKGRHGALTVFQGARKQADIRSAHGVLGHAPLPQPSCAPQCWFRWLQDLCAVAPTPTQPLSKLGEIAKTPADCVRRAATASGLLQEKYNVKVLPKLTPTGVLT